VTTDFKRPGGLVYLLGLTRPELGGSELAGELGLALGSVPQVDAVTARERYLALHRAIRSGLVRACHDLSDGGLGVALAEMAAAGRLGADIDLALVPACPDNGGAPLRPAELLYSESASRLLVEVAPEHAAAFEGLFAGQVCARLGRVTDTGSLAVSVSGREILREPVEDLAEAFKATLDW
jgi:phosphoribosylformylglycinamidine synthase